MRILLVLLGTALFIFIANANNSKVDEHKFKKAGVHFKDRFFQKNVKQVNLTNIKQNSENFLGKLGSFFSWNKDKALESDPIKQEILYNLEIQIMTHKEGRVVVKPCILTDRVHCGWLSVNCQDSKSRNRHNLNEFTVSGYTTLIFTYDQVKSQLCIDKNSDSLSASLR